jgi:hypothetical protein
MPWKECSVVEERLRRAARTQVRGRCFPLLQQLPGEVMIYYEPVVASRYPDSFLALGRWLLR